MRNRIYSDVTAIQEITGGWRSIAGSHPFHSPEWLLTWWKHYGEGHRLFVIASQEDDGTLRAVAPLYVETNAIRTHLKFLGSGRVCTDYQAMSTAHSYGDVAITELVHCLNHFIQSQPKWTGCQIDLDGVSPDANWYPQFCQQMQRLGYGVREQSIESTYVSSLPSTWSEFQKGVSKGFRRKLKKCDARLASGEFSFHCATELDGLEEKLPILRDLHQLRRASMGQAGSFTDPRFLPFLLDIARQMSPRQTMELQWCERGGRIFAMHLIFHHDTTTSMYVSGIDPAYLEFEPGHLLLTAAFQEAISRKMQYFDFLRGDEPYKQLWNGKACRLVRTYLTPATPVSMAMESAICLATRIKHQVKSTFFAAPVPSIPTTHTPVEQ